MVKGFFENLKKF